MFFQSMYKTALNKASAWRSAFKLDLAYFYISIYLQQIYGGSGPSLLCFQKDTAMLCHARTVEFPYDTSALSAEQKLGYSKIT